MNLRRFHTLILAMTALSLLTQSVLAGAGSCGNCCRAETRSPAKSCCQKSDSEPKSCCATATSCCSRPKPERSLACCCGVDSDLPPVSPERQKSSVESSLKWLALSNALLSEPVSIRDELNPASRALPAALCSASRQTVFCVWQI